MNYGVLCKTLLAAACIVANVTDAVLAESKAGQRPADQFRDAVRKGNIDLVRSMLSDHSELANTPDGGLNPPLHWAVFDGYPEIARLLLEHGAKINECDKGHEMTAIFHARTAEMAKLLLEHGAELRLTAGSSRTTPLRQAVEGGYVEVVNVYLEAGETLDFDAAAELGLTDLVAKMLKEKPSLATPPSKALHHAAGQGNLELCELLLEHDADPNLDYGYANIRSPYTPLSDAVTDGDYEIAKLLLEHEANPNVSGGRNHHNLFLFAIAYLDNRFVKLMLEHGADVKATDDWGRRVTPLHIAAALGGTEEARHGVRIGQPDSLDKEQLQIMEKVKLLLEFGADVNAICNDRSTALLFAAIAGHRQVCDLFLEKGAKLDICSACLLGKRAEVEEMLTANPELATAKELSLQRSLLHWAARTGDPALVGRLLELGADPNAEAPALEFEDAGGFSVSEPEKKDEGETPLHVAARHGHESVARLLIDSGAVLDARSGTGSTPLHYACVCGRDKLVKLLLEHGAKVEFDDVGWQFSAAHGNPAVFKLLLNTVDPKDLMAELGTDLLASAAQCERKDAVDLLLARGAKPDFLTAIMLGRLDDVRTLVDADPTLAKAVQNDSPQEAAIALAVQYGHADVVALLIAKGAEIDPMKLGGTSLLHEAAKHGHKSVIDHLLDHGLKLDARDAHGATLLHAAADGAQPEIVRFLLSQGADAHAVDSSSKTPLHGVSGCWMFVDKQNEADSKAVERILIVVQLLIDAGANVSARDNQGWTPLHEAALFGDFEIANLLIGAGADVNARDERNKTPLGWTQRRSGISARDRQPVADLLRRHGGVR